MLVSSELLLNVALQMASIDREIIGMRLDQEGIKATAVLNRAERMGSNAQGYGAAKSFRLQGHLAQVRQELALGLVVRMAHELSALNGLA